MAEKSKGKFGPLGFVLEILAVIAIIKIGISLPDDLYRLYGLEHLTEDRKNEYEKAKEDGLDSNEDIYKNAPVYPEDLDDPKLFYDITEFEESYKPDEKLEELLREWTNNGSISVPWPLKISISDMDLLIPEFSSRGIKEEDNTGPTENTLQYMEVLEGDIGRENLNVSWYQKVTIAYDLMKVIAYKSDIFWTQVVKKLEFIRIIKEWVSKLHYGTIEDKINKATSIEAPHFNEDGSVDIIVTDQYFLGKNGSFGMIPEEREVSKNAEEDDVKYGMRFDSDPTVPKINKDKKEKVTYSTGSGSGSINQDSADDSVNYYDKHRDEIERMLRKIQDQYMGRAKQITCALTALKYKEEMANGLDKQKESELRQSLAYQYDIDNIGTIRIHYQMEIYMSNYMKEPLGDPAIVINIDDLPDASYIETNAQRAEYINRLITEFKIPMPNGYKNAIVATGEQLNDLAKEVFNAESYNAGYERERIYTVYDIEIEESTQPISKEEAEGKSSTADSKTGREEEIEGLEPGQ